MFVLDIEQVKQARITLSLIIINLFCYVAFNIILDQTYLFLLAQINVRVFENYEFYRLISAMFLHADPMHIFSNMIALLIFGAVVELTFSKLEYLIIYFISGLIGNVFSLFLLSPNTISLGASGAIFGLLGAAFVVIAMDKDKTLMYIGIIYLAYYLLMSLQPGINLWAHLFGLIGGLGFGYLFYKKRNKLRLIRE
jgi:rhomboid protease GluP